MTRIRVIFKEHQERIATHRTLKEWNKVVTFSDDISLVQ